MPAKPELLLNVNTYHVLFLFVTSPPPTKELLKKNSVILRADSFLDFSL